MFTTRCYPASLALWLGLLLPLGAITVMSWLVILVATFFKSSTKYKPQHRSCFLHTAASGITLLLFDLSCATQLASSITFSSHISSSSLTSESLGIISAILSAVVGLSVLFITIVTPPLGNKMKNLFSNAVNHSRLDIREITNRPEENVLRPAAYLPNPIPVHDLPDSLELNDKTFCAEIEL